MTPDEARKLIGKPVIICHASFPSRYGATIIKEISEKGTYILLNGGKSTDNGDWGWVKTENIKLVEKLVDR